MEHRSSPTYPTSTPPDYARSTKDSQPKELALYRDIDPTAHQPASYVYLLDICKHKWLYVIRIPKKREGWKAEVCCLTDKEREKLQYEVRREALARKFDLRPSNGIHSVMIPSLSLKPGVNGSKAFALETTDGQKLSWQRSRDAQQKHFVTLSSLPSKTVMAQYRGGHDNVHDDRTSLRSAAPRSATYATRIVDLQGILSIASQPRPQQFAEQHDERNSLASTARQQPTRSDIVRHSAAVASSSSSASSSEETGPRLYGAHRNAFVGICAPGIVGAAFGSPYAAAAMNRHCIIGDDLTNLGKASISRQGTVNDNGGGTGRSTSAAQAAQKEYWASQNRTTYRNSDPRPRYVEEDLIIASLMAVLYG